MKLLQTKQGVHLLGLIVGAVLALLVLGAWRLNEQDRVTAWVKWDPFMCPISTFDKRPLVANCYPWHDVHSRIEGRHPRGNYPRDAAIMFAMGWVATVAVLWMVLGLCGKWPK